MTKKNTGGPAFPHKAYSGLPVEGLSIRDYFAAKALQGMISMAGYTYDSRAVFAYNQADAMLRAREA